MSGLEKGFNWERARQRRVAEQTDADRGNVSSSAAPLSRTNVRRGAERSLSAVSPRLYSENDRVNDANLLSRITVANASTRFGFKVSAPKVKSSKFLASYNWLNGEEPTILVPGSPPTWKPLNLPCKIAEDAGEYFREPNAARWATHPMEPAIRAVFEMNDKFDTQSIDIVACAGTLGSLFKFASGAKWDFDFDVDVVGDTVFLIRKENSPKELIKGVYGYGHTFPAAFTYWDPEVRGSASHQRVIRYSFGGLNFMIRFEADGFLPDLTEAETLTSPVDRREDSGEKETDASAMTEATKSVAIGEIPVKTSERLRIERKGYKIPDHAIFDIKTRSHNKGIDMDEQTPRLWARQIQNFIVAYHQKGVFDEIDIKNVEKQVEGWEKAKEPILSRLAAVLFQLIDVAKNGGSTKLEVHRQGYGSLEIRRQTGTPRSALPDDLKVLWEEKRELVEGATGDKNTPADGEDEHDYDAEEEEDNDIEGLLPNY